MAFEIPRWPQKDDDDDDLPLTKREDEWQEQGWTAEGQCPECEFTKGHAPGCPNE